MGYRGAGRQVLSILTCPDMIRFYWIEETLSCKNVPTWQCRKEKRSAKLRS